MQQIILAGPGKIEIREVQAPEPSEGEILLKVRKALTCGTDLKAYIRGHKLIPMPGPFGHEYSGIVAKTGKDVTDFREDDPVMGVHSAPCLKCGYCKKGLYNLCELIMENKVLGAFSEYLLLPAHVVKQNLFKKPDNLSFEQAALLEPLSCVLHPYTRMDLNEIETALVIGAGPIGLMHLAHLKTKGINITVMDISEERLAAALKMGADNVTIPENYHHAGMIGVDLVIECTGEKEIWEKSTDYVRRGGNVILFGGCPSGTNVTYDSHRIHYDELTLSGSFHFTPKDVQTAYQSLTQNEIDLSMLISGTFPLHETEKAFGLLKEGKGIKYAIEP